MFNRDIHLNLGGFIGAALAGVSVACIIIATTNVEEDLSPLRFEIPSPVIKWVGAFLVAIGASGLLLSAMGESLITFQVPVPPAKMLAGFLISCCCAICGSASLFPTLQKTLKRRGVSVRVPRDTTLFGIAFFLMGAGTLGYCVLGEFEFLSRMIAGFVGITLLMLGLVIGLHRTPSHGESPTGSPNLGSQSNDSF